MLVLILGTNSMLVLILGTNFMAALDDVSIDSRNKIV